MLPERIITIMQHNSALPETVSYSKKLDFNLHGNSFLHYIFLIVNQKRVISTNGF